MGKRVVLVVVCLFLVFMIYGCDSQNTNGNQNYTGGGNAADNNGGGSDDGIPPSDGNSDEGSSGTPSPPAGDSGSGSDEGGSSGGDSGGVPPTGNPDENTGKSMEEWKKYIQDIVDEPDATIKANLEALRLAQMSGLDTSDEFYYAGA